MAKRFARERWEVEWQALTPAASARMAADPNGYDHDRDRDEDTLHEVFVNEKKARAFARATVDAKATVYGHVIITHQRLEKIEGTQAWDWENISEPEYVE